MTEASGDEEGSRYYELNLQFHACILAISGNQRAARAYDDYVKELDVFRRRYLDALGQHAALE